MNEESNDKSILDNVPAADRAFPLNPQMREHFEKMKKPAKTIVGACVTCGNPIYGQAQLLDGDQAEVVRSCSCYQQKFLETKEARMAQEGK